MFQRLFNYRGLLTAAVTLSLLMNDDGLWAGKPPKDDPRPVELPTYSFELLGTLGGSRSMPHGMNNDGQVVGGTYALIPDGPIVLPSGNPSSEWPHAFLNIDDGSGGRIMIDLHDQLVDEEFIPPFDWDNFDGQIVSKALDINQSGQIVVSIAEHINGEYAGSYSARYSPAVLDENGDQVQPSILETISITGRRINNYGVVAGTLYDESGMSLDAAIWDDGEVNVIGDVFDVENYSVEINDDGQVLGRTNNMNTRAWRYSPWEGFVDIPLLSNRSQASYPHAMNELGDVVCTDHGSKRAPDRAVLFSDVTGLVDLGTLGGNESNGGPINNSAHVVGQAQLSDGSWRLFLYTPETGMFNLESQITNLPSEQEGMLYSVDDLFIDDAGRICGFSRHSSEAYLLTPLAAE